MVVFCDSIAVFWHTVEPSQPTSVKLLLLDDSLAYFDCSAKTQAAGRFEVCEAVEFLYVMEVGS